MPGHIREFNRLKQHSSHDLVFKIWRNNNTEATLRVFFVSDCKLRQYKPPQKREEGCERLTVFMQSRVPLGPGKFHVVALVNQQLTNGVYKTSFFIWKGHETWSIPRIVIL